MEKYKGIEQQIETKDLFSQYPKIKGRFYHGCPKNVDKLLPASITGEIRTGEENRRSFKDVIFLTNNIDKAIEYAKLSGVIYIVDATAIQYKQVASDILNPKKIKSIKEDVYIALPKDIKIVAKWHKEGKRKSGEAQKYRNEYIGEQENNL